MDRAQYAGAPGAVTANLTSGASSGSWGPDTFSSIEDLYGSANDDTLIGDDGVNRIWGVGGDDSIDGRGRADELRGGDGRDVIVGGTGDDLLLGEDDSDLLNGGDGNDEMYGGLGSDILLGGGGTDLMAGDVGHDPELTVGDPDHMNGGPGNDLMYGQGGDDCSNTLSDHGACPHAYKIPISSSLGTDYYAQMEGGEGTDRLHGGPGDDRLDGGPEGGNQLVGGAGDHDFCSFGPKDKDLRAPSCELPSKGDDKIAWDKWAWKN